MGQRKKPAQAGFLFEQLPTVGVLLALDAGAKRLPKSPRRHTRDAVLYKTP